VAREPLDSPDLERLGALGTPGGPEVGEALRVFAHLRTTPDEHRAIDWLVARDARAPLPEALLVAVAGALLDRGDGAGASRLVARATSQPALMMRAELSARAGDLGAALALVERVLSRDIDWPGARELHERWQGALGVPRPAARIEAWPPLAPAASSAFELVREVGRGGAGAVYEARDRALGRTVALKIYHRPDRDRDQLLHEARVACALAGPGIIRIFDVDPRHGWLVMQWARAGTLGTSAGHAFAWAVPLARALARLHAAGWVHHDVKPSNVLLRAADAPLLGDFGTARRIGERSPPGSLGYVSPERMAGRPSDPRDDVYGFGRILEDALDAVDGLRRAPAGPGDPAATREPSWAHWRALAAVCTGPDADRPRAGAELLGRAAGGDAG
jgi:eukaryotic-like serine/threonine-protein kinase